MASETPVPFNYPLHHVWLPYQCCLKRR